MIIGIRPDARGRTNSAESICGRRFVRQLCATAMSARRLLVGACRAAAAAHAPWRQVTRGIAGDDLSRRAITAPNTVARVSERQFLADDEAMALASRRQKMILDERRAREAAEKARVEAMESENTPPKPALDVSEDTLRNVLLAVAAVAAGAGLYAS